ncbi:hypothetical protein RB195_026174 [Necator americanus]|uniref:Chitin-binding type-2 domain-containing protein n=1 Tax=Necator americanus TaxID=51031 RepID=A0ABR1EVZ2_NECAM
MRILLLLTLTGLAVGSEKEWDCDESVNGLQAVGECSNQFIHCYNGKPLFKHCPRGLVFNPESSLCDYDGNVAGCENREEVNCLHKKDGVYTIGCSSSFFFCSNGLIHQSTCQRGLFYDIDRNTCDHKFRVRACGGHPEVQREPVTRPPLVIPTYPPYIPHRHQKHGGFARVRGYGPASSEPRFSCEGKSSGPYPIGSCAQQYMVCTDGISQLAECPDEEVFSSSGRCMPLEQVSECKTSSEDAPQFDCSTREDGNYGIGCTSDFIFCSGGNALPMKCPNSLVFNDAKGYCDYPEACQQKSGSSPPASKLPAADASKSVSSNYCAFRKNGFYSDGCTVDFISCDEGVATPMKCPPNLVFNGKKGYCDYPESCSAAPDQDQTSKPASKESSGLCVGRANGYYSDGCSHDFVLCRDGVATTMRCPSSLVFNKEKGYCDYPEDCQEEAGAKPATTASESARVSSNAPPSSSSLDCTGRRDGYHSLGCTPNFVFCNDGIATSLVCPSSLVFNMQKQRCDYLESCLVENQDATTRAPVLAPPTASNIDCVGKTDGFYSNGCSPSYVFCNGGIATAMKCPSSLVFDQKKGRCDYPENCSADTVVAPPLAHTQPSPLPASKPPAEVYAPPTTTSVVDCKGKKDGYYSNGCSADFVFCNEGVATAMKCPSTLVFNEKKGHCDYPENCSSEPSVPSRAAHVQPQSAPVYAPASSSAVDCAGKKDGYYSNGCTPTFVFCNEGVATTMKCPPTLVFNGKKGHCDYVENCTPEAPPAPPVPIPASQPSASFMPPAPTASASKVVDCKTKPNGYYSIGCTSEYISCNEGIATTLKCPSSLIYNERKGYCDYPENCEQEVAASAQADAAGPSAAPTYNAPVPSSFDCAGKMDGYYSKGCTDVFVYCNDGVATTMRCPPNLVFNGKKGSCDYVENCSADVPLPPPIPAPSAVPPPVPSKQPSVHVAASAPSATTVDCKLKSDGYYSIGCVSDYVYCNGGVATTMKCPTPLVYNEKKAQCDYPENCPAGPAVPAQTAPAYPVSTALDVDCTGKKDGYYSNGCSPTFVFCSDSVATSMKCPPTLVFNEKKGHCDYAENCSGDVSVPAPAPVPSAVVPPPAAAAAPMQPPAPVVPAPLTTSIDCKTKQDGYYSRGCTSYFVFCNEGMATTMECPSSLVFNEKKGYCDYPENCAAETVATPAAAPTRPSPPSAYAPPPHSVIDCVGKKDGYYSNGCSPTFVYCSDGVATTMKCSPTLVFNEMKGQCDYVENCSARSPPAIPSPAPVVVPLPVIQKPAPVVPAQLPTTVNCKTKQDGYYSLGCTSEFVFCNEGVPTTMKCPSALVFNEKKGYCDYPENCSSESNPAVPAPATQTSSAPVHAPPMSSSVDCAWKKDGYYSNGCSPTFVHCSEGVATSMKCPPSLVFNEKKGHCDYVENCSTESPVVPVPAPSMQPPVTTVSHLDCAGKKDGYYSNGCSPEFVFCSEGVATTMKCPVTLVFNEKKGHCDYAENCSDVPTVPSKPVVPPPSPPPPLPAPQAQPAYAPPPVSNRVDCTGKKDGYYSNGCTPEFVFCNEGLATVMKCPAALVFNEKKGHCDYLENCSSESPVPPLMPGPTAVPPPPPPTVPASAPASMSSHVDCTGKKDGYYSNGCTATFVSCSNGVATTMNCPPTLVFNEKKGHCDYMEQCSAETSMAAAPPVVPVPVPQAPFPASSPVKCAGKKDGYYSNGCSSVFVFCSEGVATPMKCPPSLVFNEKKGHCDYVENCSTESAAVQPSVTAMDQPTPAYAPSVDRFVDCTGKKDGYYSNGCTAEFVLCSDGVATNMKCPPTLVFNQKKGQCDYVENCSSSPPPLAPSVIKPPAPGLAPPYVPQNAAGSIECAGKADGYYSNGCFTEFVHCSGGVATKMTCPSLLVFNEKKGYCDYPESCISEVPTNVPAPSNSMPVPSPPSASSPEVVNCVGKSDGYYSNGCSPIFVFCSEGVATTMKCPSSLVFNAKKGHCDYVENCSSDKSTDAAHPAASMMDNHAPAYFQSSPDSGINCNGKQDGYYSNGCSSEFVFCSQGVATAMTCPPSLVFNERSGNCDYPENCVAEVVHSNPPPPSRVPVQPVPTPAHVPPSSSAMDCAGKSDGYYSNGCSNEFVFCTEGSATLMKCPLSLVFNAMKGYCDYVENCSTDGAGTAPTPQVIAPQPRPVPPPPSLASPPTTPDGRVHCQGRPEGFYSNGCTSEFFYCSEGIPTEMKCPVSLVFNEKNGYCDYPENCDKGITGPTVPIPLPQQPSRDPAYSTSGTIDCKGRPNGYHSNGCSPDFVYCNEGVATIMKCPPSLVFNKKNGHCDYVENCSSDVPLPPPQPPSPPLVQAPGYTAKPPAAMGPAALSPPVTSAVLDCTGRPNGYHSNGCTAEFVYCNEGVATLMKCPTSLVFNKKTGQCDYPEHCSSEVPVVAPQVSVQAPSVFSHPASSTLDCTGRPNGYHSNGCTSEFVFCSEGVATVMKCPQSLVFNERKGYCDYVENCSVAPSVSAPIAPPQPVPPPPALSPPSVMSKMDCTGRPDGYHSLGCTSEFFFCVEGVATMMKCPTSLVFNAKKGQCDYPENCDGPVVSPPAPSLPVQQEQPSARYQPSASTSLDCTGRTNGFHSNGCTPEFVYCVEGVATLMNCPATLVFNEKKGYCDYPESCSSAVPPVVAKPSPILPPPSQQAPIVSPQPMDCTNRPNGHYSNGCTPDFMYCNDGVAIMMKCPSSLVFNEKKGYCDYPESCSSGGSSPIPLPPVSSAQQDQRAPQSSFDCTGRQNGHYSNGCSTDFVYCYEGVATTMRCPSSLVFNEQKGYCDYPENCSAGSAPLVPPVPAPVAPSQSQQSPAYSPSSQSIDCTGRPSGYYSMGCSGDFVFCNEGNRVLMKCPSSLVFNEKKGYCDYPENCKQSPAVPPVPAPQPPSQPPALSPPSSSVSCAGRQTGYYSNGCTADFVYCNEGVATQMKCPSTLVFNMEKGYCDYVENCSADAPPPASLPQYGGPQPQLQPVQPPVLSPPRLDCTGRQNGHYSVGCSPDFVFCHDGVATMMKCPSSLVFNEQKGYCDYPESCLSGGSSAVPPPPVSQSQLSPPSSSSGVNCAGRENGYYSTGCSGDFVFCSEGVATMMRCPTGLVFNEDMGYCDYPDSCSSESDGSTAQTQTPKPTPGSTKPGRPSGAFSPPATATSGECAGRQNGYYSNGCSSEFVYCNEGVPTAMKCPSSLVFNEKMGYCDYPELCASGDQGSYAPPEVSKPSKSALSFVCPETNGVFSLGCSVEFVVCSNDVAQLMTCPEGLVFNAAQGYCDHKENCREGLDQAKPSTTPSAPTSSDYKPPSISSECTDLPDGTFGSQCGSSFVVCSNGVSYTMSCPSDLVFDAKKSRCVYPDECGEKSSAQSPAETTTPSYVPQNSRNDCVGKPDGLHSLGCIGEFLQCVDGRTYSLYCPAGLVFVEQLGACDVPSACKPTPKPENVSGPLPYEPVMSPGTGAGNGSCDLEGYFSHFCAVEFFNCVHGRKFVGKCPAGLVFNPHKNACDYVESCVSRGEDQSRPSLALPIPSTETNKDNSCKDRPDGVITDSDCQPQFTTCLSGTAFVTKCPAGLVYSIAAKLCDYPEACERKDYDKPTTAPAVVAPPAKPDVTYQDTAVGMDLCLNNSNGPMKTSNCRHSFSFCVHSALYTMKCPDGLLFSVVSHKCEWASMCDIVPETTTTLMPVTYVPTSAPSASYPSRDSTSTSTSVTDFDCTNLPDGNRPLGECVGRFVMCSNGHAYVQFCPHGLVYNSAKGACDYECGAPTYPQITTPSQQVECLTSQALGRCSSRFNRCLNGRLVPSQCPGKSLFDEALSLCVYDLPECRAEDVTPPTYYPPAQDATTPTPVRPAPAPGYPPPAYEPPQYSKPQYEAPQYTPPQPSQYQPPQYQPPQYQPPQYQPPQYQPPQYTPPQYQPPQYTPPQYPPPSFHPPPYIPPQPFQHHPFPPQFPPFLPMPFPDVMHGRDRVNKGMIPFEPRSMLNGERRYILKDIFDGHSSPYLYPFINRIFVPNHHKKRKHHDRRPDSKETDFDVSKLFESVKDDPELPMPIQVPNTTTVTPVPIAMFEEHTDEDYADDHEEEYDEEVTKGSGVEVSRRKRSYVSVPENSEAGQQDFSMCTTELAPGVISLGFCRQDFIFCRALKAGLMAACPVGDLFDGNLKKCVSSRSCGKEQSAADVPLMGPDVYDSPPVATTSAPAYKPIPRKLSADRAAPRYTPAPPPAPVTVPSVPMYSAAYAVPTTTTTMRPPYQQPLIIPVPIPAAPPRPAAAPVRPPPPSFAPRPRPAPVRVPRPVSASFLQSNPMVECTSNTDYALDCSGNFVKCVHGIAYKMKCPEGLVYDQTKQYCDYPGNVLGCSMSHSPRPYPFFPDDEPEEPVNSYSFFPEEEEQMESLKPHKPRKPHRPRKPHHLHKPYRPKKVQPTAAPVLDVPVRTTPATPDFCATLPDGLHSQGCTASFVICTDGRIQASMNCPMGTFFDENRQVCEFKEKVVACGGSLDEPAPVPSYPVVTRTTTPSTPARDDNCPGVPQAVGRCSSKFVICSNGIESEFNCSKPLVFNPLTNTCDFREFVSGCEKFQGLDVPYYAAPSTQQTTTTTQQTTTTTEPLRCIYNDKRPAFALDYCSRIYGICTLYGILKRDECAIGFLFDSHLNTCVPAEQCGQERLKELLSQATHAAPAPAAPVSAAQVDQSAAKYAPRKDDRCRNTADGVMKPLGRCRSSYIRCTSGEVMIEPCATAAEVFSVAAGACVLRVNAPECHSGGPARTPSYAPPLADSNDPLTFCKARSDGLYRNPTDCAGILQCFGGDVFEYPSCSSGLVFNEATGKCDYREAVPECKLPADDDQVLNGCRGASHGDLVPHEGDCRQFYRCVWDRLERMHCPSGTVFNPELSLCDYPANVPQCRNSDDVDLEDNSVELAPSYR